MAGAAAAAVGLAVLAGCASTAPDAQQPPQSSTATVDVQEALCEGPATEVVAAVDRLVAAYASPSLTAPAQPTESSAPSAATPGASSAQTPSPQPSGGQPSGAQPSGAPSDGAQTSGDDLATAVEAAQRQIERLGCDPRAFTAQVTAGLDTIEPSGPVATAVWRRVSASVLGEVEQEVTERSVSGEEDLLDAVAHVAAGSTILLPEGTTELSSTIVLLDAITLRGQGMDSTSLVSSAPEAAIIVATDGLVEVGDLTLRLAGTVPASGLVAGPSASVALAGVRVSGAVRGEEDGAGGAGVYMSAVGDAGSGRGTTLEVTSSVFEGNGWAGIAIAGGHRVSIEQATVTGNGEVGILFMDSASGSVAASTLTDNAIGLAATGAASPAWLSSTVTGGVIGAQVDARVTIVMQGMRVTGPTSAAVLVGGEATGAITGLTCSDTPYGIVIGDTAAPTLTENDCPVARGG